MNLPELIQSVLETKDGNREMALRYFPEANEGYQWRAEIGNTCPPVALGESVGEFSSYGNSLEQALRRLLAALQ